MATFVLAASDVQQAFDQADVAPAEVLHLHRAHRGVGRDDRGAVDVFPLRIGRRDVKQPLPFFRRQRATDRSLTLGQVLDVISERSPSAARLEDTRSTPTSTLIVRLERPAS